MTHKHGGDIYSYHDIKDFSANINFRGMPSSVRDAAIEAVDESVHYPDPKCRSLRTALAEREKKLCAAVVPEHIICGNGAAELIFALAGALQPKHALLAAPSFFEYEQALQTSDCEITRFALKPDEGFRLGETFLSAAAAFGEKLSHGNRMSAEVLLSGDRLVNVPLSHSRAMIILGNPNNPTGALIETAVLEELISLCERYRILLVLDESFLDFLDKRNQEKTFSGVTMVPSTPNVFVIRSFTKIYAIPGLRFGYGLCSDGELVERMRMLVQPWNVSVVAQKAAVAAAGETEFARISASMISENREVLIRALRETGLTVFPSAANFLLLRGPAGLKTACLEDGILIRDCGNFPGLEPAGDGKAYFRVCVRSRAENEELADVIRRYMGSVQE